MNKTYHTSSNNHLDPSGRSLAKSYSLFKRVSLSSSELDTIRARRFFTWRTRFSSFFIFVAETKEKQRGKSEGIRHSKLRATTINWIRMITHFSTWWTISFSVFCSAFYRPSFPVDFWELDCPEPRSWW